MNTRLDPDHALWLPEYLDPRDAGMGERRARRAVRPRLERTAIKEPSVMPKPARPVDRHPNSFVAIAAKMIAEGKFRPKPAPAESDESGVWAI